MKTSQAETLLAILYNASMIFSIVSLTSLAIIWQHWEMTLNVCISVNCGCILYGINTFSTFMGGDIKLCHFGVYGLVPTVIIGLCLGVYHIYRCCINRGLDEPRAMNCNNNRTTINGQVVVIGPKRRTPFKQWMSSAFCAALFGCLSLAHAVVMTDGFYKTCEQYKRGLIQLLGSRGREAHVIRHRLACGAIFDYMDYLQPDANNFRRGEELNTGFALQLAIICTWLNFFTWVIICLLCFTMAKKKLNTLGEYFCCC
ncbi:uncharacterized protein LOC124432008 [Vespa crabro]|uniref:uncharacterized protein LOC124432008 n=1 Tax=Vespa crabro TaxID=7445 RepID=UPI001F01ECA8|nr:uncharacterized protein LOC124432008 [Vespa crabro]XP_046836437.1 uncharacterized protein LOC124432008 [Vespa crabro]XP_046836438.1 uncharacterized protein LOC124432008 [Vespa crabro]XP_046836439.1 uncharacterized protein LOC124432008 [Vespa crabro]XP_046836440.1 uncharacterized protein LOC124432008 [Vespa crabro]XP_046836441.1 uncharacterized protein LOC124432008 [Vespa crabro]XP_046836442.1 uncharacterized protein LOC124432008 [Vespa crabro]